MGHTRGWLDLNKPERCHLFIHVCMWGVQVLRYPNFFLGMEADRNVEVVGGDMAFLKVGRGQVATLYYPLNACDEVELQ